MAAELLWSELEHWNAVHARGFHAAPMEEDGEQQIMKWSCAVPGRKNTCWEGSKFWLIAEFPKTYPKDPPKCIFSPPLFHPNVTPTGEIRMGLLDCTKTIWTSRMTIGGDLLTTPARDLKGNSTAHEMYFSKRHEFFRRVRQNPHANMLKGSKTESTKKGELSDSDSSEAQEAVGA